MELKGFISMILLMALVSLLLGACAMHSQPPQSPAGAGDNVSTSGSDAGNDGSGAEYQRGDTLEELPEGYVDCNERFPDARPEVCTSEYAPVCAAVDNGIRCVKAPCPNVEWQDFSNGCVACTDENVFGYVEGEC